MTTQHFSIVLSDTGYETERAIAVCDEAGFIISWTPCYDGHYCRDPERTAARALNMTHQVYGNLAEHDARFIPQVEEMSLSDYQAEASRFSRLPARVPAWRHDFSIDIGMGARNRAEAPHE